MISTVQEQNTMVLHKISIGSILLNARIKPDVQTGVKLEYRR